MTVRRDRISLGAALAATLLVAACGEEVVLEDAGEACLSATPGWPDGFQSFEAGAPAYVTVRLNECLSSSCTSDMSARCDVEVTGDRIVISAQGSYTDESGASRTCTDDCMVFDTACETPALAEGTYTVAYGEAEITLGIPSLTGASCLP